MNKKDFNFKDVSKDISEETPFIVGPMITGLRSEDDLKLLFNDVLGDPETCGIVNKEELKKDPETSFLYYQAMKWGELNVGKSNPNALLKKLGYSVREHIKNKEIVWEFRKAFASECRQKILSGEFISLERFEINKLEKKGKKLLARLYVDNVRLGNLDDKLNIKKIMAKKGSFAMKAYAAVTNSRKSFSLRDAINLAIPLETKEVQAYDVLRKPFKDSKLESVVRELYFAGKDIMPSGIRHSQRGKSLHAKISEISKKYKVSFSKTVCAMLPHSPLNYRFISVENNKMASNFQESIIHLFFAMLKRNDPYLTQFPELKKLIGAPIINYIPGSKKTITNIQTELGGVKEPDGIIKTTEKCIAVEIKTSTYNHAQTFLDSINQYGGIIKLSDNTAINEKLIIIDKPNGNFEKINKYVLSKGWKLIKGDDFYKYNMCALDLHYKNNPEFSQTSPLNELDVLKKMYKLFHEKQHIISRNGFKKTIKLFTDILNKDFEYVDGKTDFFSKETNYSFNYKFKLSDMKMYPELNLKNIPYDTIFFDIETLGLSYDMITYYSWAKKVKNEVVGHVKFTINPFEEKTVLKEIKKTLENAKEVVSFNGVKFDEPVIKIRMFLNMIKYDPLYANEGKTPERHVDLMPFWKYVRRKDGYKYFNLKTFEKTKLHMYRKHEISGSKIPEEYIKYQMGEAHKDLSKAALHNMLDVFSLVHLYAYREDFKQKKLPLFENV